MPRLTAIEKNIHFETLISKNLDSKSILFYSKLIDFTYISSFMDMGFYHFIIYKRHGLHAMNIFNERF